MIVRSIILILFSFNVGLTQAQPIIPRFETIGVNEGLSQSSVYSIHQDRFGFMWFGTADGLNRYDGSEVKVYKVDETQLDIETNYIRGNLCEDEAGNVWFTNEAGIHMYDQGRDAVRTILAFRKSHYGGSQFEAVCIRNNVLWMLNPSHGVFRFNLTSKQLASYRHPLFRADKNRNLYKPTVDAQGNIWFTYVENDGLVTFNMHTLQFTHHYPGSRYVYMAFGNRKHYLVGLYGSMMVYDSVSRATSPFRFSNAKGRAPDARIVFEDRFHRLWGLSPGDGLACFDPKTGSTFFYRHDNAKLKSLPIDILRTFFIDRNDNLWIGTDGAGVCKLDLKPPKFNLFPLNDGDYPFLKDYFTKCFYEDAQRHIWFGTHNNGFNILNPNTGEVENFGMVDGKPLMVVGDITPDADGKIWIGHSRGFSVFDKAKKTFTPVRLQPDVKLYPWAIYVYDLQRLQNGEMMAATQWGVVHFRKTNGQWQGKTYYHRIDLGSTSTSVKQAADGSVWIGSPSSGLLRLAVTDTVRVMEKHFEGVNIRSIHLDESDPQLIWLCTTKGLIAFNCRTHAYTLYTEKNGLVNQYVYGVLEDEAHNLWISTNGGLSYFNRKTGQVQNYTFHEGLQSNEFNTGAFYKGTSGTFYFGGIKGFNWFRDIAPEKNTFRYEPAVAITGVFVDEQPYLLSKQSGAEARMVLPHDRNNLSFHFAALDFTRPQSNKIQYRLEGWDPKWFTTQARSVRYPNLSPGRYVFSVKAVNGDGFWSREQRVLVWIKAPFWQQWWFYAIIGITVLAAAVIITRSIAQRKLRTQLRELEKQKAIEAERNRISRDMHDEIGSGLTHIALKSELMQAQPKAAQEIVKDVGEISSSARKLVESMSEIIWALNPHNDSLENLLAYLREQTIAYFEPFEIAYCIHFPESVPPVRLSNEQRRNIFLVIKEALHNALKHAAARQVSLSMHVENHVLHFQIRDDGKGFEGKAVKLSSNGLRNMQRRMEDIGGQLHIVTNDTGTLVDCQLPIMTSDPAVNTTFFTWRKRR